MKMPMAWHEECLTSLRSSLESADRIVERAQMDATRLEIDVQFYERQIDEAKSRGWIDFDRDRLLRKRAK
jgi:hypothetical protein